MWSVLNLARAICLKQNSDLIPIPVDLSGIPPSRTLHMNPLQPPSVHGSLCSHVSQHGSASLLSDASQWWDPPPHVLFPVLCSLQFINRLASFLHILFLKTADPLHWGFATSNENPCVQWINICLLSIFCGSLKSIFSLSLVSKWQSMVFFLCQKG